MIDTLILYSSQLVKLSPQSLWYQNYCWIEGRRFLYVSPGYHDTHTCIYLALLRLTYLSAWLNIDEGALFIKLWYEWSRRRLQLRATGEHGSYLTAGVLVIQLQGATVRTRITLSKDLAQVKLEYVHARYTIRHLLGKVHCTHHFISIYNIESNFANWLFMEHNSS